MCGIAGIFAPERMLELKSILVMINAISHRGPDDSGAQIIAGGTLGFGHRRLSILDLSLLGHQPMSTPDRKSWIVYNGEIYNFKEIRSELQRLGIPFTSESDTEVILAAYAQWGLGAVERFRGMFAFALWNEDERRLHLCRDRFGVKPLYYSVRNGTLAFASELRALNLAGHTSRTVDPSSALEFLQYGYISAPKSIFEDIRAVRPGTIISFDWTLHGTVSEYWSARELYDGRGAQDLRAELIRLPEEQVLDRVESALQEAFNYRMVADVPVGVFLSGGIDSSLVAALLASNSGRKLKTFTIGYGNSEFDETAYARKVADLIGAEHSEFIVSSEAALDVAMQLPNIADEPIGDSSLIPTYLVSRLARNQVKVALSADGADELFGGYARYSYCGDYVQRRSRFLKGLYRLSSEMLDRLPAPLISKGYKLARLGGAGFAGIEDKLRKFVRMSRAGSVSDAYDALASERSMAESMALMKASVVGRAKIRSPTTMVQGGDIRDGFMHWDLSHYLPGDLLTKVDRASMAVSLEAREPFLDHVSAQIAAALPMDWKIRGGKGKFILRRILQRRFPISFFDRPKQGFSAPVGQWLRGPLREALWQELSAAKIQLAGVLDPAAVRSMVGAFLQSDNGATSAAGVWMTLQLQQWANHWLGATPLRVGQAVTA
ncbi:MAG TPA: asparagine synthase (glutamine-hydrolyzing) [Steroidobacteraceae bacterium]|jgi:asparagine synthase (glutamine-hydrolysing)|nr:asparagine synthase (glutamine-hydrolyzing) [Steroidobacteraceae bacterium]